MRRTPACSHRSAFTLLEIILAVSVAMGIILMAVPSVSGMLGEQKLRRSFEAFDDLVQEAKARSIEERRPYVLIWGKDEIVMRPREPATKEESQGLERIAMAEKENSQVEFPAAIAKPDRPEWTFWPTGTCEPAVVKCDNAAGTWQVAYEPLTVQAVFERSEVR